MCTCYLIDGTAADCPSFTLDELYALWRIVKTKKAHASIAFKVERRLSILSLELLDPDRTFGSKFERRGLT